MDLGIVAKVRQSNIFCIDWNDFPIGLIDSDFLKREQKKPPTLSHFLIE